MQLILKSYYFFFINFIFVKIYNIIHIDNSLNFCNY